MDYFTSLLAKLFDLFKAKNPVIAAVIVALLIGFAYLLQTSGDEIFGDSATILKWVNWILLALQGSRTTQILSKK